MVNVGSKEAHFFLYPIYLILFPRNLFHGSLNANTGHRPSKVDNYENQRYEDIRAQLVNSGSLFEDEVFPAIDASVFYEEAPPHAITWLRPFVSIIRFDEFHQI